MSNYYSSGNIEIFPSSNAIDNGKVTSEKNVRNIVSRLKIKNYKMNSEDFPLSVSSGKISIGKGVALIYGYRIETSGVYTIEKDVPTVDGDYYVLMSIILDNNDKIKGDNLSTSDCEGVEISISSELPSSSSLYLVLGTAKRTSGSWLVKADNTNIYPFSSNNVMLDSADSSPVGSITYEINKLKTGYISSENDATKTGNLLFKSGTNDVILLDPNDNIINIYNKNNSNLYMRESYNDIRFYSSTDKYSSISGNGNSLSLGIDSNNYISISDTSTNGISLNGQSRDISISTSSGKSISLNNGSYSIEIGSSGIKGRYSNTNILSLSSSESSIGKIKISGDNPVTIDTNNSNPIKINKSVSLPSMSIDSNLSVGGNLSVTGYVTANKVYNAVYNGFGEIFRKPVDEVIDYGDVVCIGQDGLVHKVSEDYGLNRIIGICSNTIGIELGGNDIPEDEQVEVELIGKIWVKTDSEFILPGSLITFTIDGKAKIKSESDIQHAIALSNVKNGKVLVYYSGSVR